MNISWPLTRNIIRGGDVSNTFGMVRKTVRNEPKPHQGWDFSAKLGTPVLAVADGEIVWAGIAGDYGKSIILELAHSATEGKELYAFYAHLSKVEALTVVKKGQVIGLTGESGNAQGMPESQQHLHFEFRTCRFVGTGLEGRISPLEVYKVCPLTKAINN